MTYAYGRPLDKASDNGHRMSQWGKGDGNVWVSRCERAGCQASVVLRDPQEDKLDFSGSAIDNKCAGNG